MKTGENGDNDLDAIIRAQLAHDALQSSSSVEGPSSARLLTPLSDREFGACKSRRDKLFEGYRRVKRSRVRTGSRLLRDPELEATLPGLSLDSFPISCFGASEFKCMGHGSGTFISTTQISSMPIRR